jgi:hypothetical protein
VRRSIDNDEVIWRELLCPGHSDVDIQYFDRKDQERELKSLTQMWMLGTDGGPMEYKNRNLIC